MRATRAWANAVAPYDFVHGSGTYFASALDHFLAHHLPDELRDVSNVFVVFPDSGAYRRFKQMVIKRLAGIAEDHVLYIAKTRVIAEVRQTESLFYRPDGDLSSDPSFVRVAAGATCSSSTTSPTRARPCLAAPPVEEEG